MSYIQLIIDQYLFFRVTQRSFIPVDCRRCLSTFGKESELVNHLIQSVECLNEMGGNIVEAKKIIKSIKDRKRNKSSDRRKRIYNENQDKERASRIARYHRDPSKEKASDVERYGKNSEHIKDRRKERYWDDPEKEKNMRKERYQEDPEKEKASDVERYKVDSEHIKDRRKERYQEDPEKEKASDVERYKVDSEHIKDRRKERYWDDPEKEKDTRKERYKRNTTPMSSEDDLKIFLKSGIYGPSFPCVVCHELHWKTSMYIVKEEDFDETLLTVDYIHQYRNLFLKLGRFYCCKTCHHKIALGEMPRVAAKNHLECPWDGVPQEFLELNEVKIVITVLDYKHLCSRLKTV